MPSVYDDLEDGDLGQRIKRKNPGKFDDIADADLGKSAKLHPMTQSKGTPPPPPTAAHPTTPEANDTIKIQLAQLKAGKRRVVMFPRRTPVAYSARQFNAHRMDTAAGTFFFNPRLISAADIRQAIATNDLPSILGDKDLGYGAPDKSALTPPIKTVTARAPSGVPVQDVATDQAHEPEAQKAAEAVTPPGGSVEERSADDAIAERISGGDAGEAGSIPHTDIPDAMEAPPQKRMKFRKAKRLGLAK